jgi:hypothetical protein
VGFQEEEVIEQKFEDNGGGGEGGGGNIFPTIHNEMRNEALTLWSFVTLIHIFKTPKVSKSQH